MNSAIRKTLWAIRLLNLLLIAACVVVELYLVGRCGIAVWMRREFVPLSSFAWPIFFGLAALTAVEWMFARTMGAVVLVPTDWGTGRIVNGSVLLVSVASISFLLVAYLTGHAPLLRSSPQAIVMMIGLSFVGLACVCLELMFRREHRSRAKGFRIEAVPPQAHHADGDASRHSTSHS